VRYNANNMKNDLPRASLYPVFLCLSYLLSGLGLVAIWVINHRIARTYERVDGKTKRIFGVVELSFVDQYYLLIPLAMALLLGLRCYQKSGNKRLAMLAVVGAGAAIVLLFSRVWRLLAGIPL
jgi:hypothetical protein